MAARPRARTVTIITAVLIVALALRVLEVQRTAYRPVNDAGSYLTLASQITHTGGYGATTGAGGARGPTAYFPPGFPYLLASVVLINVETPRFREPIDCFVIMLAACALAALVRRAAARLPRAPARRRNRAAVASRPGQLVEMVKRLA